MNHKFKKGREEVTMDGIDLNIGENRYHRAEGLWKLLTLKDLTIQPFIKKLLRKLKLFFKIEKIDQNLIAVINIMTL